MKRTILSIIIIAAALCGCSVNPLAGGNSSQTGNGLIVTAQAKTVSGSTLPQARVAIYEAAYQPFKTPPGLADSTIADRKGRFAFSIAREGFFNLVVSDTNAAGTAFVPHIPVFADSFFSDTLPRLEQPGYCKGTAADKAGRIFALSYVYITGSPFYTVTKNNGDFLLGPVPAGAYVIDITANFQVINAASGQFAPAYETLIDSKATVIAPGNVSEWRQ